MERKQHFELMEYKHQDLMWDLNEFCIDIKVHLFGLPHKRHKPTVQEIDLLQHRINEVLRQDAKPFVRR